MKRLLACILTAVLVLGCGTVSVFAAGLNRNCMGLSRSCIYENVQTHCGYVDEDADGICDNRGLPVRGIGCRKNFTGDGVCDGQGAGKASGICNSNGIHGNHGTRHGGSHRKGCGK